MMAGSKRNLIAILLLLKCILILTACSAGGEDQDLHIELPPEPEEGVMIYAALNPVTGEVQSSIDRFNESHTDVQIEVRDYSDENGPQRLLVELAAGRVPDIMEMRRYEPPEPGRERFASEYYIPMRTDRPENEYWMPYRQMAQKGYLEDLWPYIRNDQNLGGEGVLEAPLKAAEVDGGLFMLFRRVRVSTLMGPENLVGDRYKWTFDELAEAFSTMPEDSTILRYNLTKWEVFSQLLSCSLDKYIDWEGSQCSFDGEEFRNMLLFLNNFPDEAKSETEEKMKDEIVWRIQNGRQMLEPVLVSDLTDIVRKDAVWREQAAFPGYPAGEGSSGSFFVPTGNILAMSSACRYKEAAWDLLREQIVQRYKLRDLTDTGRDVDPQIPINGKDYRLSIQGCLDIAQQFDDMGIGVMGYPPESLFSDDFTYEDYRVYITRVPSKDDVPRFEELINNTTQIYWPNDALANIVWESAGAYFAGDRTLDETVALIQNRVTLYVNENK